MGKLEPCRDLALISLWLVGLFVTYRCGGFGSGVKFGNSESGEISCCGYQH